MKIVLSAAQAKQQDADFSGDLFAAMDRAGYAVAATTAALGAGYGRRVAVLAGAGNNGGDGYVAARYLARRGALVVVHALAPPATAEARQAAAMWRTTGGKVMPLTAASASDFLIDALFGVGFHGDLPTPLREWSGHQGPVVAVDVPSGLDATTGAAAAGTLRATRTVALSNYKLGHFLGDGPDVVGGLGLAPLGLPDPVPSAFLCEDEDAPRPARSRTAHKWSAGSVAVIGGSAGMAGAAILAAQAALGFGAGAVATFVPAALAAEVDASHPEIMTHAVGEGVSLRGNDAAELLESTGRFDVVVIGPGLGASSSDLVAQLLAAASQPVVLDADGLNATTADTIAARRGDTVITPHGGEFARLAGEEPAFESAIELAQETSSVVLLKGPTTIVAAPGSVPWLVTSGGRELATVGTGDVLAGMIAALIGRGLEPATAARSAAHWHGKAGAHLAATSTVTADRMAEAVRRFAN